MPKAKRADWEGLAMTVLTEAKPQAFLRDLLRRYTVWQAAEKEKDRMALAVEAHKAAVRFWFYTGFRFFIVVVVAWLGYMKVLDPCVFSSLVALIVGTFFGDGMRR